MNPVGLRIGITNTWKSKWFGGKKEYKNNLRQDIELRVAILKKWMAAAIAEVEVERSTAMVKVIIKTARPGVLIGRGGSGVEDMQNYIKTNFFKNKKQKPEINNLDNNQFIINSKFFHDLLWIRFN